MKVITVCTQKGGAGKTTTATVVASILNKKGYKTLLIDEDAQCNATDTYGASTDGVATLFDVMLYTDKKDAVLIKDAIQHTEYGDIVASDRLLVDAEAILMNIKIGAEKRLKNALLKLEGYDYVIIDTNPSVNRLLYNAIYAADYLLIPAVADRYGYTGLAQLTDTIDEIKTENENLKIAGILLIKYKANTSLGKNYTEAFNEAARALDTSVFNIKIRESVRVQEAQDMGVRLIDYAPTSNPAIDYMAFVDELLERIK